MKNVLIAGASGMVGNIILDHCLSSSKINKVTSLVILSPNAGQQIEESSIKI